LILPSCATPADEYKLKSFRTLKAPLDWVGIFNYIGISAYMKHMQVVDGRMSYRFGGNKEEFFPNSNPTTGH